ncbi:MAG TPA: gluconokinase [Gemmatimonadota bacterium]|nr:gluconokinase [Gemmatimonadota bacterium]
MIVVVMGVSGAGKTTVGSLLADDLGWPFHEGDDFHPPANIARMAGGVALTDRDRRPWLDAIAGLIRRLDESDESAIIACSALKASYRERLRVGARPAVRFVYLQVDFESLRTRLEEREFHFMDTDLLTSQFADLEEPEDAVVVDATLEPEEIVRRIRAELEI